MTRNIHNNQAFRTIDLLGLVFLVGAVCSIFGAILAQAFQDDRPQRARTTSEALVRQIYGQQLRATQSAAAHRGPASVQSSSQFPTVPMLNAGEIGRDPWGKPFHYLVRKDSSSKSRVLRVYVWSDGPNGKSDTDVSRVEILSGRLSGLRADDVGFGDAFPDL